MGSINADILLREMRSPYSKQPLSPTEHTDDEW